MSEQTVFFIVMAAATFTCLGLGWVLWGEWKDRR